MDETKYELARKIEKFDNKVGWRILNPDASYYEDTIKAEIQKEISGLIRSFEPEVVLEWCTPGRIISGERKRPCCTYDGCGSSDDESGSTWTEKFTEAQYWPKIHFLHLRVPSLEEGIIMRREVLQGYFEQARTNSKMRKVAIQYKEQIRNFLATHKR